MMIKTTRRFQLRITSTKMVTMRIQHGPRGAALARDCIINYVLFITDCWLIYFLFQPDNDPAKEEDEEEETTN